MQSSLSAEVNRRRLFSGKTKTIYICPANNSSNGNLKLAFNVTHVFTLTRNVQVIHIKISMYRRWQLAKNTINFYRKKRVTLKTLPWGTPSSCVKEFDKTVPSLTWKCRSFKKFFIKIGRLRLKLRLKRSLRIPYLHVRSYAFSISKNTETRWLRHIIVWWICVSKSKVLSIVDLPFRKPLW